MDELIIEIMMNMTLNEILDKTKTNKKWYNIISDDKFWCKLLNRDFNIKQEFNCKNTFIKEYKKRINMNDIKKYSNKYKINYKYLIAIIEYTKLFTKKNNLYMFNKELKHKYFYEIIDNYPAILNTGTTFKIGQENLIEIFEIKYFFSNGLYKKYILEDTLEEDSSENVDELDYERKVENAFMDLIDEKYPEIHFNDENYIIILINPYDLIEKTEDPYEKFSEMTKKLFLPYNEIVSDIDEEKFTKNIMKLFEKNNFIN